MFCLLTFETVAVFSQCSIMLVVFLLVAQAGVLFNACQVFATVRSVGKQPIMPAVSKTCRPT